MRPKGDMPQDDQDVDIDGGEEEPIEGAEVPEGQIEVRPDPDDEITVTGSKITLCIGSSSCSMYFLQCFNFRLSFALLSEAC